MIFELVFEWGTWECKGKQLLFYSLDAARVAILLCKLNTTAARKKKNEVFGRLNSSWIFLMILPAAQLRNRAEVVNPETELRRMALHLAKVNLQKIRPMSA